MIAFFLVVGRDRRTTDMQPSNVDYYHWSAIFSCDGFQKPAPGVALPQITNADAHVTFVQFRCRKQLRFNCTDLRMLLVRQVPNKVTGGFTVTVTFGIRWPHVLVTFGRRSRYTVLVIHPLACVEIMIFACRLLPPEASMFDFATQFKAERRSINRMI